MKDFISANNVSFNWEDRLSVEQDYTLYVNDCNWVLYAKGYYEFYYNPRHFCGKIVSDEMPNIVLERMRQSCAIFEKNDLGYGQTRSKLCVSHIRFPKIEREMRIGNWFYAQGQHYATWKGRFICDDMYIPNCERECSIKEIDGAIVYDMIRMGCQARTPNYIRSVLDLSIFDGVDKSKIIVRSYSDEWDSNGWSEKFKAISEGIERYHDKCDISRIRAMRIDVFNHTVQVLKKGYYELNGSKYSFSSTDIESMICGSKLYSTHFNVNEIPKTNERTKIVVENIDCLQASNILMKDGYNVAVLNMANRHNPGGGVMNGAGAQEENIFRRTNILLSMYQYASYAEQYSLRKSKSQYPLNRNYGGIYTPNAIVFRGLEEDGYPLLGEESFKMSFISVPAINRPELDEQGNIAESLIEPAKDKMRTILRIGLSNGHDALVLGAMGCGAFRNPPSHIARLFHEVIIEPEFKDKFKLLYFAIKEDHNSGLKHNEKGNYLPFKNEFCC